MLSQPVPGQQDSCLLCPLVLVVLDVRGLLLSFIQPRQEVFFESIFTLGCGKLNWQSSSTVL